MNTEITGEIFDAFWTANKSDLLSLLKRIQKDISEDEIEGYELADNQPETPHRQITISVNDDCTEWRYQTGDNSYTGGCYGHQYWGVGYVYKRDCDLNVLAKELIEDLADQIFS